MEVFGTFGTTITIYFPLVDNGTTDFESTPVTIATGDSQISKDGAAFGNTTNNFAHEGNGIYSLVLTATEMQGTRMVVTIIDQTGTKLWVDTAIILNTSLGGQIQANQAIYVIKCSNATFSPTTTIAEFTMISPNTTVEVTSDHFNGRLLAGVDLATQGQLTDIVDYVTANSKLKLTYTALTESPPNNSIWVIQ